MRTGGILQKGTLSLLLSSLGMGCAVMSYLFLTSWAGLGRTGGTGPDPLTGLMATLLTFTLPLTLALLALLNRIKAPLQARKAVLVLGFGLSLLWMAGVLAAPALASVPAVGLPAAALVGVLYACMLCAWVQSLTAGSAKAAMTSVSLGLLFAGAASLPFALGQAPLPALCGALPLCAFGFFCAARFVCRRENPGSRDAATPAAADGPLSKDIQTSAIPLYAVLLGFATTQFFTQNAPINQAVINVGTIVAAGTLFLLVSLSMIRALEIRWLLFICAAMFSVVILFWFMLRETSALIVLTTGSLHWASFLILAVAGFRRPGGKRHRAAVSACWLMCLFYAAAALGGLTTSFGAVPRAVFASGALVLFLVTFAIAHREQRSLDARECAGSGAEGGIGNKEERDAILHAVTGRYGLTARETEILCLFAEGNSLRYIADTLFLSENTVKRHRTNIYRKTEVNSRQELIDMMRTAGWRA